MAAALRTLQLQLFLVLQGYALMPHPEDPELLLATEVRTDFLIVDARGNIVAYNEGKLNSKAKDVVQVRYLDLWQ